MTEKEMLIEGMNHLAEASYFFSELTSDKGIALAFMSDNLLKYGESILQNVNPNTYNFDNILKNY